LAFTDIESGEKKNEFRGDGWKHILERNEKGNSN